jgi:hypothetical protein
VQFTDRHDVQGRLQPLLEAEGLRVGMLRASVDPAKREAWIARHGPKCDVCISHAKLVETGLDLFAKGGAYNFATLVFYQTPGYNPFTLRQAARRSWRIGQQQPCKVFYLYYARTMQERALALMGKKLLAAQAIEGKFAAGGLADLAGDDEGSTEMALARSLAECLDEGEVRRAWGRVAVEQAPPEFTDGAALCRMMRAHKVTIRELAGRLGVTQAVIKQLRVVGTSDWAVLAAVSGAEPARPARTKWQGTAANRAAARAPRGLGGGRRGRPQ